MRSAMCAAAAATPEGLEQRLMQQPVDVLDMVIGFVSSFDLLLGLTGVDAFQDA